MNLLSTFRGWLVEDLGWKIFSLVLAVAIWLTVHRILLESVMPVANNGGSTLTYGNLPVIIVATAADVHLYRVVPETIKVTVSGSPEIIAVLQANQIRATVDLTGIESAVNLNRALQKRSVDVSVPSGVTVLSVEPAKVGVIMPPAH
jgi:YbbR domain-containing protein